MSIVVSYFRAGIPLAEHSIKNYPTVNPGTWIIYRQQRYWGICPIYGNQWAKVRNHIINRSRNVLLQINH